MEDHNITIKALFIEKVIKAKNKSFSNNFIGMINTIEKLTLFALNKNLAFLLEANKHKVTRVVILLF